MPGLQPLEGIQHESDARLHVESARSPEAPIADAAGHGSERAERIHRIVVPEQQYGLLLGFAREVDLEMIAEIGDAVELGPASAGGEFLGGKGAAAVDRLL